MLTTQHVLTWHVLTLVGLFLAVLSLGVTLPTESSAQSGSVDTEDTDSTEDADDTVYRVRALRYVGWSHVGLSTEQLDWERILLSRTERGLVAARREFPTEWVELGRLGGVDGRGTLFFASALREIPTAITRAYRRGGIGAVRVTIKLSDLESLSEADSDGVLPVHIVEGTVGVVAVRALVGENTLDADETLAGVAVDRIVRDSPVRTGDLVEVEVLRDYTFALNRFRHRRVDIGLRPGANEGEVQLDYWVTAVRPWTGSLEVDNTGTPETGRYRERASWRHQNFSGRDDRLSFGFATAEFDAANAGFLSYELPLRSVPLLSIRVFGVHSEYDASEVGAFDLNFSGEATRVGVELRSNLYGHRGLFTDVVVGGEVHRIATDNETVQSSAEASFAIGSFGVEVEQREADRSASLRLYTDWSLATLGGSDGSDVERLGRTNADDDWRRVRLEFAAHCPIDALLGRRDDDEDPSPVVLSFRVRGQDALGSRTPANFTQLVGGLRSVRGYPEAFSSGDRGFSASAELSVHLAKLLTPGPPVRWLGRRVHVRPESKARPADWDVVARVFLDGGRVEQQSRLSFERNVTLISSGIGCDVVIRKNARLRVDWGMALENADNGVEKVDAGENRWHVGFVLAF